ERGDVVVAIATLHRGLAVAEDRDRVVPAIGQNHEVVGAGDERRAAVSAEFDSDGAEGDGDRIVAAAAGDRCVWDVLPPSERTDSLLFRPPSAGRAPCGGQ